MVAQCGAASDTECQTCTVCDDNEFESSTCGAGDAECLPYTDCGVNMYVAGELSEDFDLQCGNITNCDPGWGTLSRPTSTSDRTCARCPSGSFSTQDDPNVCRPWQICTAGQYVSRAASVTADRECNLCSTGGAEAQWTAESNQLTCNPYTTCASDYFVFEEFPLSGDRICRPLQTCAAGSYVAAEGSYTADRHCCQCDPSTEFADDENLPNCTTFTECTAGQHQQTSPTVTSDRVCVACEDGTFQSNTRADSCANVTRCDDESFISVAASPSSDTVCQALSVCSSTQFESQIHTPTSNRVCFNCSIRPTGHYQRSPCTATNDASFTECSDCQPSQFEAQVCTALTDTECTSVGDCSDNQYQSAAPTSSSDRRCASVLECRASSEFEVAAPSPTANRVCRLATVCDAATQYQTAALTNTSDRSCATLRICSDAEYEIEAPTSTTDRDCSSLTVCMVGEEQVVQPTDNVDRQCASCPDGLYQDEVDQESCKSPRECALVQYMSVAMTETSDRRCTYHSNCTALQFEASAGTADTDRQCEELTVCDDASEYEDAAHSETSDRVCAFITDVCPVGQGEGAAPTLNSDRECVPCDGALHFQDEADQVQCKVTTNCSDSEFETATATRSSDRTCAALTICNLDGEYYSNWTQTSDRSCINQTICDVGDGEIQAPTATTDRMCDACDGTTQYQDVPGTEACKPVRNPCPADTYGSVQPTVSTDRVCSVASFCNIGDGLEYIASQPTISADRTCANVTLCDAGTAQSVAPTPTTDRRCDACDGTSEYQDERESTSCKSTAVCSRDAFERAPSSPTSDRDCRWASICETEGAAEFIGQALTLTSDRTCNATTICRAGSGVRAQPTATSDRACVQCDAGFNYQDDPTSEGCNPVAQDCAADAFTVQPATSSSDRQCTPLRTCEAGTMVDVRPTVSSDRECRPCNGLTAFQSLPNQDACASVTECLEAEDQVFAHEPTSGEFELTAPTSSSDRQCQQLTSCTYGERVARPHTATSDRVCGLLEFGTALEVSMSSGIIAAATDPSVALGLLPSESVLSVMLHTATGYVDMSQDPSLIIRLVDEASSLVEVSIDPDGGRRISVRETAALLDGTVELTVSLEDIALVAAASISVQHAELMLSPLHPDQYAIDEAGGEGDDVLDSTDILHLRRWDWTNPALYQGVSVVSTVRFSNSTTLDLAHQEGVQIDLTPSTAAEVQFSRSDGTWYITPSTAGAISIQATIRDVQFRVLQIEVVDEPTISVSALYDFSIGTVTGPAGIRATGTRVRIGVEFSNGLRIPDVFATSLLDQSMLQGLVHFDISDPQALRILDDGSVTPLSTAGPISVTATAGSIQLSEDTFTNIVAAEGDLDLGAEQGRALAPRVVGERFSVPVFVNTGARSLGAFQVLAMFNPSVIQLTGVQSAAVVLEHRLTALGDAVMITGAGDNRTAGLRAPLLQLNFVGVGAGASRVRFKIAKFLDFSPAVDGAGWNTIGEARARNSLAADAVQLVGTFAGGSDAYRHRRMPSLAMPVPAEGGCATNPITGDVNADCTFSLEDIGSMMYALYGQGIANSDESTVLAMDLDANAAFEITDVRHGLKNYLGLLGFLQLRIAMAASSCAVSFNINVDPGMPQYLPAAGSAAQLTTYVGLFSNDRSFQDVFDQASFVGGTVALRGQQPAYPHYGGVVALEEDATNGGDQRLIWLDSAQNAGAFNVIMFQQMVTDSNRASQWYLGGAESALDPSPGPAEISALTNDQSLFFAGRSAYRQLDLPCNASVGGSTSAVPDFGPTENVAAAGSDMEADSSIFVTLVVILVVLIIIIAAVAVMRRYRTSKEEAKAAGDIGINEFGMLGRPQSAGFNPAFGDNASPDGFDDAIRALENGGYMPSGQVGGGFVSSATQQGILGAMGAKGYGTADMPSVEHDFGFEEPSTSFYNGVPGASHSRRPGGIATRAGDVPSADLSFAI